MKENSTALSRKKIEVHKRIKFIFLSLKYSYCDAALLLNNIQYNILLEKSNKKSKKPTHACIDHDMHAMKR